MAPSSTLLDTPGPIAEAARELTRRRADLVPHARGSLEQHLVGVHDILRRWGQPERVRLAGLLHSAYSTEAFRFRLFEPADRSRVREIIGADAERLVFAFCACERAALITAAEGTAETIELTSSRWPDARVRLGRRDLAELMVIHAANIAEQSSMPRGGPSRWLAVASRLLGAARTGAEVAPPALAMRQAEEASLLRAYRGLLPRRAGAPFGDAGALSSSPVGEPLVLAALLALAKRSGDEAAALADRALAALDAWGFAWDKRLTNARWRELAEMIARDGRARDRELHAAAARARIVLETSRGSPERIWTQMDALGALRASAPAPAAPAPAAASAGSLPPRFAQYIAGLRNNSERTLMQFYPGLRAQPWHDSREFPIVADLERLAADIAKEAKSFEASAFQDEAEGIGRSGRWSVLFLMEMGRRRDDNLARCPALRSILERHRTLTTHAGLMYFSSLDPRTRVAAHYGPTNVRLRCHLGIDVPEGCGVRVGGVNGAWQEGRCIVFDDSFEHEVWNDSDRRRLVLVLDLWHPDLTEDEVSLLAGLHRYGAANEASTQRYWARNEQARARGAAAPQRDPLQALDQQIGAAMRAGDLARAGEGAARYVAASRGTRWFPVRRADDPLLPASVPWSPVLTPGKLRHDIDQFEYLKGRGILADELTPVIEQYDRMLDTLRPLGPEARVPLVGAARAEIGHVYSRLVHVRRTPRVQRALSREWSPAAVEDEYMGKRPSVAVVDGFLSDEALSNLRAFCLESTIWSINRYNHDRLGSFFRDGFNCPLLVQIAEELRAALPRVVGPKRVTQLWGYKYATTQPDLPAHADFAAVNVNFWITPDDANLEPDSGGLVVYDVDAPKDWDFRTYNRDAARIQELLAARNARPTIIPYRCNRAVIFDSDLFHTTPALRFRGGYENRRINVTVLFGDRQDR